MMDLNPEQGLSQFALEYANAIMDETINIRSEGILHVEIAVV